MKIMKIIFILSFILFLYSCSVDNDTHKCNFSEWIEYKQATCENEGLEKRNCACGVEEERIILALGHKYICFETRLATCEDDGLNTYICFNNSDHTYTEIVNAKGHEFSSWETIVKSTCMNEGLEKRKCACGTEEERVIESLGHNYVCEEISSKTCNQNGILLYTCSHDSNHNYTEILKAEGHIFSSWRIETTETCYSDGMKYRECFCGYKETSSIKAKHIFNEEGKCTRDSCDYYESIGIEYIQNGNTYEVSGIGICKDVNIVIPESVIGLPVTSIRDGAFKDNENIVSIILPDTIKSIGNDAFYNSKVQSVTVSSNLESIGDNAFRNCYDLLYIFLPNSLTYIGDNAFYKCLKATICCDKLTDDLENKIYKMAYKFYNKQQNQYLIDNGIMYIIEDNEAIVTGYLDVENAIIAEEIEIASQKYEVTKIGNHAFFCGEYTIAYNNTLKTVEMPDSIIEIGNWAFGSCEVLEKCKLSINLKKIGECAFYEAYALSDIELPYGLEEIGEFAFNLTDIRRALIPSTVVNVGMQIFDGGSIISCDLPSKPIKWNSNWISTNSIVYWLKAANFIEFENVYYEVNNNEATVVGFNGIANEITISEYVEIDSISYPVTKIARKAFYESESLIFVAIPNTVVEIGSNILAGCDNLKKIILPFIGDKIEDPNYTNFGYLFGSGAGIIQSSSIPTTLEEVVVNGGTIENNSFYGAKNLKSLTINANITSIEQYAFHGCENLQNIDLPTSIKRIERDSFDGCKNLKKIFISKNVEYIGYNAFYNCENLTLYCEYENKPIGWGDLGIKNNQIVWGYVYS